MTQPGMVGDGNLPDIPAPQVLRYTATASPIPTAAGDGLTLVGADSAPVDTPTAWPTDAPGTAHPCALLEAGVYIVESRWAAFGNVAGSVEAHVAPVDTVVLWTGTGARKTLVATAPVRLYAAATADHDDPTRVVDLDLWVIRLGDL